MSDLTVWGKLCAEYPHWREHAEHAETRDADHRVFLAYRKQHDGSTGAPFCFTCDHGACLRCERHHAWPISGLCTTCVPAPDYL